MMLQAHVTPSNDVHKQQQAVSCLANVGSDLAPGMLTLLVAGVHRQAPREMTYIRHPISLPRWDSCEQHPAGT